MPAVLEAIALILLAGGAAGTQVVPPPAEVHAPDPGQDGSTAILDEVVVTGKRLEEITREYVESLAAPARRRGLARWTDEVCIGVVNFRPPVANLIIDRISEVAGELAIQLGEPGCDPNLFIIGATDAPGLARELVQRRRRDFFRFGFTSSNRGSGSLARFQTSEAPVRWWHVSLPIVRDTGQAAVRLPGEGPAPGVCRTRSGSWGANCDAVYDRLLGLITIVDVDGLGDVRLDQLADYLALVALAQVDPEADHRAVDTVLNLFEPGMVVEGLTEWDRSYLQALYSGEDEHLTRREQASRMLTALQQTGAGD